MIILAGDIGGTKTWLQIADSSSVATTENKPLQSCFTVLFEQRYVSAEYDNFDILLRDFLQAAQSENIPSPEQGCIGVAGLVIKDSLGNDTATVTNLPWVLDAKLLVAQYPLRQLHLINDFQAIAFGLEILGEDEVIILQENEDSKKIKVAPKVVIGAGTGLGQALLVWSGGEDDGHYEVIPSEGGHGNFAPCNKEQQALLSFLDEKQARVSVEDVLSGRGLVNIYHYLSDKYPADVSEKLNREIESGDAAAVISKAGLSVTDSLAGQALRLFVEIYGAQAGNFALSCMATGGVYIAGGIAAKIQECFTTEIFLAAFHDKGPMQKLMQTIPVKLVLNPQVGLKGAALVASRL